MLASILLAAAIQTHVVVLRADGEPATGVSVEQLDATHLRVRADGCTPKDIVAPASSSATVTLTCGPPTIASVRVATGSPESLHRLPVPASVLDRTAIARSAALTPDDLLRLLPGVDRTRSNSQFTNYGQLRVSFTGAGTDRGLVLADGIPADDGFGGQIDWAAYPPEDLTRVELLRGAGSALYGAGAVGGVLALTTFGPQNQPEGATFTASGGTQDYSRLYARAATPIASKFDASAAVAAQTMSYFDLAPGYTSSIDSAAVSRSSMASAHLRYVASPNVTLRYGYRGAWDYQQEGRPNYDFWRRQYQNDIGLDAQTAQSAAVLTFFTRDGDVTNRSDQYPAKPGVLRYTQDIPTSESGLVGQWSVTSDRSTFEVRGDGRFIHGATTQFGPTNAVQSSVAGTQTLAGLGIQETWHAPKLELVAGARGDVESVAGSDVNRAISPRVALRYDFTPELALRISDGSGFRPPFLNELIRSYQIGSVRYLSNPNLVPERSNSFSTGLDWAKAHDRVAFDVIHTVVNDAIGFATIDATHQIRSNFGQAQTDGQTLTYTRSAGCSNVTLSETTQYARVTQGAPSIVGKRLQYVPQASATAMAVTTIGVLETGASLSYLGQTYADDLNAQPLGTALLANLHVGIPLHGLQLRLEAANLTDARYLSSIDRFGPPMTVSIGVLVPAGKTTGEASPCSRQ